MTDAAAAPSAWRTRDLLSTAKKSLKLFTEYLSSDSFRRCSRFAALRACSSAMSGDSPAASSAQPSPTPDAQIGAETKAWAAGTATTIVSGLAGCPFRRAMGGTTAFALVACKCLRATVTGLRLKIRIQNSLTGKQFCYGCLRRGCLLNLRFGVGCEIEVDIFIELHHK